MLNGKGAELGGRSLGSCPIHQNSSLNLSSCISNNLSKPQLPHLSNGRMNSIQGCGINIYIQGPAHGKCSVGGWELSLVLIVALPGYRISGVSSLP